MICIIVCGFVKDNILVYVVVLGFVCIERVESYL